MIMAQTGLSPWMMIIANGAIFQWMRKPRLLAVTDRRIAVFRAGRLSPTRPKELLTELPRQTMIGPVSGMWTKVQVAGESMWISRAFKKDVEAANAALTTPPPAA